MNRKRYNYSKHLFLKKVGTGVEDINDEEVPDGKVLVITNQTFYDEDSNLTYVRFGKESGGSHHVWDEKRSLSNDNVFALHWEFRLREGEKVQIKISGGAASDKCNAFLDGYWYYDKGSE